MLMPSIPASIRSRKMRAGSSTRREQRRRVPIFTAIRDVDRLVQVRYLHDGERGPEQFFLQNPHAGPHIADEGRLEIAAHAARNGPTENQGGPSATAKSSAFVIRS